MAMPTCVREEDDDDDVRGRRPRGRRARHWVGLAIVGVQMAAWCLVGALLMHRGVANLRRRDALAGLAPASARVLPAAANDSIGTTEWPLPTAPTFPPMSGETDTDPMAGGDGEYPKGSFHHLMRKWSSFVPVRPMSGFVASGRASTPNVAPATPSAPGSPAPAGKTAGAATAVVMVTVGGVMLVVGPAFMAIKIMDVYHRQKRLGKVSRLDDPPPSYDEVAEKAPRYSALFQVLENGELAPLAPLAPLPFEASASVGLPPTTATPGPSTAVDVSDSWDAPEEGQDQEADASTPLQNTEISRTSKPCDDDRRRSV